ncbi:hypothetical protein EJ07DRAFT_185669 [Lizonia empirigonia]|nr:hypothetical protein EJ07DRAFT_185669 [Lizonia empirigonia]
MSSHEKLSAASNDRKARLAQLKSLNANKRPETPPPTTQPDQLHRAHNTHTRRALSNLHLPVRRNFDPSTRNVKLGFENTPIANPEATLEYKAAQLALATKAAQAQDTPDAPSTSQLDLKRDLHEKMRTGGLLRETESAIARLVRERIEAQRREKMKVRPGEGEEVGLEGGELVEAMHLREAEEERERRRDEADDLAVEG